MTQNQIANKNAIELQRHNKATEEETVRHQRVMEAYEKWKNALTAQDLAERKRSNLVNEDLKRQQNVVNAAGLSETLRHNLAIEELNKQTTSSQTALNRALETQAAATAASNYASAALSGEKVQTERTVQALNAAQSGFTDVQRVNYPTQVGYVLSQTDLNRARVVQSRAETGRTEVQTLHEGVSTVWDSISSAFNILSGGSRVRTKVRSR